MSVRVIGLMSGTSLDGIDAALVRFDGDVGALDWTLDAFVSSAYPAERRRAIFDAIEKGDGPSLCLLHARLGDWLADAALAVCAAAGVQPPAVDLIGSHGQTVWHEPPTRDRRGATLQLGCPATIAERTGIDVVSDFRTRDVAAGGHGAPLVPWADRYLFAVPGRTRVLLNIGGIANLTRVPPRGSDDPLFAFDTGPGNALIDAAVELATGGARRYDADGQMARRGTVDEVLLGSLLAHPFHEAVPPKSTGREVFGRPFVASLARDHGFPDRRRWDDLVATLTALTARGIGDALRRWVVPRGVDEVVVTGGGARNPVLLEWLREALAPIPVIDGRSAGIDPDAKEAIAFAGLAWAHVHGVPGNMAEATGAAGPRVLGSFTPGARTGARFGG
ncbi:MAG: anhydro-N-acetylmuramic acid kinase [Longimicrobiales bacterium]